MKLIKHKNRTPNREWGCPKTKSRTNWCYALCRPDNGIGDCGRPAYHAYRSRIQKAILNQRNKEREMEKRGIRPLRREVRLVMSPTPVSWVRPPGRPDPDTSADE